MVGHFERRRRKPNKDAKSRKIGYEQSDTKSENGAKINAMTHTPL